MIYRHRVPRIAKQLLTLSFVMFAWIFFRAETFSDACAIVQGIFQFTYADPAFPWLALALILSVWAYQFICETKARAVLTWTPLRVALVIAMIVYVALFATSGDQPFIYFQF